MENEELELKELEAELAALEEKEAVVEPPKKPTRRRRSVVEKPEGTKEVETTPIVEPEPTPTPEPKIASVRKLTNKKITRPLRGSGDGNSRRIRKRF